VAHAKPSSFPMHSPTQRPRRASSDAELNQSGSLGYAA
jgi:hypothetical protein